MKTKTSKYSTIWDKNHSILILVAQDMKIQMKQAHTATNRWTVTMASKITVKFSKNLLNHENSTMHSNHAKQHNYIISKKNWRRNNGVCTSWKLTEAFPLVGRSTCTVDDHHRFRAPYNLPTSLFNSMEDGWSSPPLGAHCTYHHSHPNIEKTSASSKEEMNPTLWRPKLTSTDAQHREWRSVDDRIALGSTRVPR